jgi:hypothetical protein
MKHLRNQTLLITPKLKDWHGQGTLCISIKKEHLKIFSTKPDGVRRVERPKWWWEDGVDQVMRILEVQNWSNVALNRDEKAKFLKKATAHYGLSSQ